MGIRVNDRVFKSLEVQIRRFESMSDDEFNRLCEEDEKNQSASPSQEESPDVLPVATWGGDSKTGTF